MEIDFEVLTNQELKLALKKQNILIPTLVQEKSIPLILSGIDLVASSQTGTGKTLAYLLPLFLKVDKDNKNVQAVVLTPTHELAVQVCKQAELLSKNCDEYSFIEPALIIGGANISRQLEKLKAKPRIIIGSVGRILEIIKLKKLTSHFVKTIVIDEADRMLDKKSITDVELFIKTTLKDRQILLFSASIDKNTIDIANIIMKTPEIIDLKNETKLPKTIEHLSFLCEYRDKVKVLRKLISSEKIQCGIVFMSNPNNENIDKTVERLIYHNISAVALYGDVQKHDRRQALEDFRDGRARILICSDLASRGMDFENLTHVINFDMPENPDLYLHRAGRCGRVGKKGTCISIITQGEIVYIKKMKRIFNITILEKTMSFGKIEDNK